jgi:glycosyltransferase involved in cell wall biosynthesis
MNLTPLPKVSIVIPCRNEVNYIAKNIDSILQQNYNGEIEVLVVDGMSDDGTREIVLGFNNEKIKLVDNPHRFTPQALNIGVENAKGEIFIILGGHAFLDKNFVRKNVEVLNNDTAVGCSGGQILNIYENNAGELISKAMSSVFGVGNATFRTGGDADYVDTVAFGAYYKSVHDKIGGFDEDLVRNQDDEYNYKITKAGYKIYFDPTIISNYYVRGSIKKLYKQYYQYGYWKVYVNKKHKTITTLRQLVPLFLVLSCILGTITTLFLPLFGLVCITGLLSYLVMALIFGVKKGNNFIEGIRISQIFPVLHFSYGFGYLIGIIQFVILGKKPSTRSKSLSRD